MVAEYPQQFQEIIALSKKVAGEGLNQYQKNKLESLLRYAMNMCHITMIY